MWFYINHLNNKKRVKVFLPLKKTTVTSTVIECNVHKKKTRVYPKSVYKMPAGFVKSTWLMH